ncbi:DNA/RNA endonuclease [Sphingomonas sp. HMWF008]|nr:DNA/RNA endonuclease [Sphingomonas sp. HMWF008]
MRTSKSFRTLVETTRSDRRRVRNLVATQQWKKAEPDKQRLADYLGRTADISNRPAAEAVQGNTIDFQPVSFLSIGARVQRAVAYIEVMAGGKSCLGTGFLISPDLLITNQHVVEDIASAQGAQVTFDRQADATGRPMPTTSFALDPDRCALFSAEDQLDFAVIALGARLSGAADLVDLGYCPLSNRPDKHIIGMNINIIQHPEGAPKMIAVRNNLLTARTDRTLLYETDTDHGSSGSPVFNDMWEVIALHHFGEPFLERQDDTGKAIPDTVNEGVRISAIYNDLAARVATLGGTARTLVETALSYDKAAPGPSGDRVLGPPRPTITKAAESQRLGAESMTQDAGQEIKVVIPIEVTVRVGSGAIATAVAATAAASPAPVAKTLVAAAEKLQVDKDYSNRDGYQYDFITGFALDLPKPDADLAKQIGTLRADQDEPDKGILKYEHFSVVMNKAKRIAMFTATNIDGETYVTIDRKTGLHSANAQEGETWWLDPRISASFFIDQTFYSAWSVYFDRGHLTRRTDPTWGTPEIATRANADTYHFTNCSPQHFRFNESSKFWQGVERYVLEKGVLAADTHPRLCVFQGPIFSDAIDRWADDVQVPSSFFKIVVWKGHAGLQSVGLVVDQLALLDEKRVPIGLGGDAVPQVNQWRVAISTIEKRTGLDFGKTVRDADTITAASQLPVGEAQTLITSFDDILA